MSVRARPWWRWVTLAVGTLAQAATCSFTYGIPMLVPALRAQYSLSLPQAGLLVSAPTLGLLTTLILWGAAADRYGEKVVMATGTAGAAVALGAAAAVHSQLALGVLLVAAGCAGGSVNAASGRLIMGWFARSERGVAMGTRQTAQPLGVAVAALVLPGLARDHGPAPALLFPAAFCGLLAVAVAVLVGDPPRPSAATTAGSGNPYRGQRALVRVHLASSLLVVPQFAISAFTLVYLVGQRHWDVEVAGRWVFAFQLAGAAGRVVAGRWTDRVGSRLGPMRQLAVAAAVLMLAAALCAVSRSGWIVVVFALSAVVTVADNGMAFTAVAEMAGTRWSGRCLGVHNTLQNVVAVLTPPVLAAVVGTDRYGWAFALVAVFPLLAVPMTPVRAERRRAGPGAPVASAGAAGRLG